MLHVTCNPVIELSWLDIAPICVGAVPTGLGTPDAYVLVTDEGKPCLRIDAYENHGPFQAVLIWHHLVVVGFGQSVYLISLVTQKARAFDLEGYFGHLHVEGEYLLVASAERIYRINPDSEIAWVSQQMGIDGVVIDQISAETISGEGEWDPPGGWKPFRISAITGQVVDPV